MNFEAIARAQYELFISYGPEPHLTIFPDATSDVGVVVPLKDLNTFLNDVLTAYTLLKANAFN